MAKVGFDATKVEPLRGEEPKDTTRSWTPEQNALFQFIQQDARNGLVQACAGSGKTTSIVEGLKYCNGTSLFLAFNKSIADELKLRGVNARTFHSFCYGPVLRWSGAQRVSDNKLRTLTDMNWSKDDQFRYSAYAYRLVGLAKQCGMGIDHLTRDTRNAWVDLASHHDLGFDDEDPKIDPDYALDLTRELFTASINSREVDFDDLLFYPVKFGISLPKFDYVFCDEVQDTNMIQRELLKGMVRRNGRILGVGDEKQAIYGFRGADSDSMRLFQKEFNCKVLPLSTTWRCATSIVDYVHQWQPNIHARPGAPTGVVEHRGLKWHINELTSDDLVICRTSAPLIAVAFRMLKNRMPVTILGREIGEGLKKLIGRMKAVSIEDLETKLERFRDREVTKFINAQQEKRAEAISDRVDAILVLCESLDENERNIDSLFNILDRVFANKSEATKLATVHKAKGLESDRVWWLNASKCPSKWAKKPWQKEQEINLCYVAATRAAETLITADTE